MTASVTKMQDQGAGIKEQVEIASPHQTHLSIPGLESRILNPESQIPNPKSRILLQAFSRIITSRAWLRSHSACRAGSRHPLAVAGVKPGLANIVILIVLYRYGWRTAHGCRCCGTGRRPADGQLPLPGFFSACRRTVQLAILAASQHLPQRWFGPVTHSILAAFAHIAGSYCWFISG